MKLLYDRGTLLLEGKPPGLRVPGYFAYDSRVNKYRTLACNYWKAVQDLGEVQEEVFQLPECSWREVEIPLRPYQEYALEAWVSAGMRGVVVLPTGSGKTMIGLAAIVEARSPTLIVVPTLELVDQWSGEVRRILGIEPAEYTGEEKEVGCVTVSTYSSAYINAELLGNRFKLLIFDEVHHLPGEAYRQIAELSPAPMRLGLTATPERQDGLHSLLPELVGPVVYRLSPRDLEGKYLSSFEIVRVAVELPEDEARRYSKLVETYRSILRKYSLSVRTQEDFERLVRLSARYPDARNALLALMEARRIAYNTPVKVEKLKEILARHRGDRVIVFTETNDLVRLLSKTLLVPEITHKTPKHERRAILEMFRRGEVRVIATSHVLEEGIDVPEANVAVIISGTASPREYIQRLGRILRPREGKRAILYEIVTRGTKEQLASRKRRKPLREETTRKRAK